MELLENAYIYCFKLDDKYLYIGKTHRTPEKRLKEHLTRCHNEKLKKYIDNTAVTFQILYESHNQITEEILNTIEESYITTLQPECNILGIEKPYDLFSRKTVSLDIIEELKKKKTIAEEDADQLLRDNPQIKVIQIHCPQDDLELMMEEDELKNISKNEIARYLRQARESKYGKLNDFNKREYFNPETGSFQQKAWCIRNSKTKEKRFLTLDEKINGLSEENKNIGDEIVQCFLIYFYRTEEEIKDELIKILMDDNIDELDKIWINIGYKKILSSRDNFLNTFYPFEYIKIEHPNTPGKYGLGYPSKMMEAILHN